MDIFIQCGIVCWYIVHAVKIHQRFPPAKTHTVEGIMVYHMKFRNSCYYYRQYHAHIL